MINSRLGLFTAAHFTEHPFSRSYGVILPSSLTRVRSLTLEFSSQLPVSVCGTGGQYLTSGFSWQCESTASPPNGAPHHNSSTPGGFAYPDNSLLGHALPVACLTILLRHHIAQSIFTGTGISACLPSPTRLRLGLGPD